MGMADSYWAIIGGGCLILMGCLLVFWKRRKQPRI
ncbi:LPXTG cell wall anchor domain-containing protein [uncultured Vagococcus sp.]